MSFAPGKPISSIHMGTFGSRPIAKSLVVCSVSTV
jgi:hypothetical protein